MKTILNSLRAALVLVVVSQFFLTSCNKDLEQFPAIVTPVYPSGNRIAATIAANANYSFYNAMITRSGLAGTLNDSTKSFTLFATDNNGMKIFVNAASGGAILLTAPDASFLAYIAGTNTPAAVNLSAASAAGIIQYNLVGGKFPFSDIPAAFPNYPLPSQIILDGTRPFIRLPIFPVNSSPVSYVNNIPVNSNGKDMAASNGVIHTTFTIVAPPSKTLRDTIANEATLKYFRAAILRADSGQVVKPNNDSTNFLNYLLGYGVTNMTVLTPNDAAFQNLIFGLAFQSYLAGRPMPYTATDTATAIATGNGAVAVGPAFLNTNNVSTAQVRGIMAYHFIASNTSGSYSPDKRIFSVNLPAGVPTFLKTLVNGSIAAHPGISTLATFSGPTVSGIKFTGYGTGTVPPGVPYTAPAANAVLPLDRHAVNGVYNVIDRVLLPQ